MYDFIKYRSLRNVSVLLVLFWAVVYVIDFGLLFCVYQYGSEVHQNWMLICVAGVFGGKIGNAKYLNSKKAAS